MSGFYKEKGNFYRHPILFQVIDIKKYMYLKMCFLKNIEKSEFLNIFIIKRKNSGEHVW